MVTYQLTLYKIFFAQKHGIDLKDIETYFALLKRTAKKDHVEIFRVTSGNKKQNNALALLKKALFNIKKKRFIKDRRSCGKCDFHKTSHCP
jgi:glutamyl/glutaminyl-tRNA synthetase